MNIYDRNAIGNILEPYNDLFYKMWDMGVPCFNDKIPTACVGFNKAGDFIQFNFNPSFYAELSAYERAFIIAHESLHIILNHGKRSVDKLNYQLENIAMDLAIHEVMFNHFEFDKNQLVHSVFDDFCELSIVNNQREKLNKEDGKNRLPLPPNLSFEEYFHLLYEDADKINVSMLDDHSSLESTSDIKIELNEEYREALNNLLGGTSTNTEHSIFNIKVKKKKKWESIIRDFVMREINFTIKEQWAIPNPRFALLNSRCMLPHNHRCHTDNKNKKDIFLFQDTSGSCVNLAERFLAVARSIPLEHFNVKFCCFDTKVYEVDYMKGELAGFGGTSFKPIEDYIQSVIKKENRPYPQGVFIVTDGYGDSVSPEFPKKWHWILSSDYKAFVHPESKTYNLKEFE